jgi:hypothetical protein
MPILHLNHRSAIEAPHDSHYSFQPQKRDYGNPGSGGITSGVGVAIIFGITVVIIIIAVVIRNHIRKKTTARVRQAVSQSPQMSNNEASRSQADDEWMRLTRTPRRTRSRTEPPPSYDQAIKIPPPAHQQQSHELPQQRTIGPQALD